MKLSKPESKPAPSLSQPSHSSGIVGPVLKVIAAAVDKERREKQAAELTKTHAMKAEGVSGNKLPKTSKPDESKTAHAMKAEG